MSNKTHVVTGKCRFESVNLQKKGPYSLSLVFSKRDEATIKKIRDGIEAAVIEAVDKGVWPERPPFVQDPVREYDADSYFMNVYGTDQPGLVGLDMQTLPPEDLKSGDLGRASLDFYVYTYNGHEGVAAGLNNLQQLESCGKVERK